MVKTAFCLGLQIQSNECDYIIKVAISEESDRRLSGANDSASGGKSYARSFIESSRKLSAVYYIDYSTAIPPPRTQKQMIQGIEDFVNGTGNTFIAFSNYLDGQGILLSNLQESIPPMVTNSTVVRNAQGVIQGYSPRAVPVAAVPESSQDNIVLWILLAVGGAIILTIIIVVGVYVWRYGTCVKAEC